MRVLRLPSSVAAGRETGVVADACCSRLIEKQMFIPVFKMVSDT